VNSFNIIFLTKFGAASLGVALLFLSGCGSSSPINTDQSQTPSTEVLHISSFSVKGGLYESSQSPLFKYQGLEERIIRELIFQLESRGIEHQRTQPETTIYFFYLPAGSPTIPESPYSYTTQNQFFQNLPVDSLSKDQQFFVLDVVDPQNNQLVWRGYDIVSSTKRDSVFSAVKPSIERILRYFPG